MQLVKDVQSANVVVASWYGDANFFATIVLVIFGCYLNILA